MDSVRPQAPTGKERFSVVRIPNAWYVACGARELRDRPLSRTILGTPIVLFRDGAGRAGALLDRCAHRNAPLSLGRCVGGRLECAYHGWKYDREGLCREIPAWMGEIEGKGWSVPAFAVAEQQGFVWVFADPDREPPGPAFSFPHLGEAGYTSIRFESEVEATLHATLENMLDVPHTAFLHRGLFRGGRTNEVTAIVRRFGDRVEAQYVGEPRPSGLAARILAPGTDATVEHFDRFLLPSISQVEYRLGSASHLFVCAALTPVSEFRTRFYAVVSFRLPLPAWLVRIAVEPIARRIFRQDAEILRHQTETIRRFGGERFVSTEIDLLGPHMWRLLREAEEGSAPVQTEVPIVEREVRLRT